jgi:hypothetical protein
MRHRFDWCVVWFHLGILVFCLACWGAVAYGIYCLTR